MIWNSRSARLMAVLFLEHDPEKWEPVFRKGHAQTKQGGSPMLTPCWQQVAAITRQHFNSRGFVHDDSLWFRRFPAVLPRPGLGVRAFGLRPMRLRGFAPGNRRTGLALVRRVGRLCGEATGFFSSKRHGARPAGSLFRGRYDRC